MKSLWLLAALLTGCAHTDAPKAVGTPALDGTWHLRDVRCASGDLGHMGAAIAYAVHSGVQEEFYVVDNGAFSWHVRERKARGAKGAYCETVMSGNWTADGKSLVSSGAKLETREGKGGFQCYEPFRHPKSEKSAAHAYELGHDRLVIHHKDPVVKVRAKANGNPVYHGCDNGSDLLYVFERK